MIIGLSGRISSGKSTVSKIIKDLTNGKFEEKMFAYKLKQTVALLTGCNVNDLESQDFKNKKLGEEWGSMTYRTMLQKIGTEAMREQIHENVWVNALFQNYKDGKPFVVDNPEISYLGFKVNKIELIANVSNWIISDVRMSNELKAVEDRGGITIRINRKWLTHKTSFGDISEIRHIPQFDGPEHPSETALDNATFKYTIDNNGTIEELIEKVRDVLIKESIL